MSDNWYVAPTGSGAADGNAANSGSSLSLVAATSATTNDSGYVLILDAPGTTWDDLGVVVGMKLTADDGTRYYRTIISLDAENATLNSALDALTSYAVRVGGPRDDFRAFVTDSLLADGDVLHIAPGNYLVQVVSPPMSAQQIRDALCLAPTATPAAGSVDNLIRDLILGSVAVRL